MAQAAKFPPLLLLAAALLGHPVGSPGQEGRTGGMTQDPPRPDRFAPRLVAIPFIYYTPETKLAFGAGAVLNFRAGRRKDQTRASTVWAFGTYSLARQFQVVVKPEIYFERNRFFLSGNLRYERTPQKFFGVGNDTAAAAEETFTPRIVIVEVAVKKKFLGHFFAGLLYEFEQLTMESVEPGGLLEAGGISGSRGGLLSGFGFSLDWDTRDGPIFPRRGVFLQFVADTHGAMTGSDFTFSSLKLDLRRYIPVRAGQVLAVQVFVRSSGGDPPFFKLAYVGGETLMRGYYKGRFRDRNIMALQAEYRVKLSRRWGVAGFAGLAEVFARLADFRVGGIKYSMGGGLRYTLNKREGTNLRLDAAWGPGNFGVYFTAQEAF